MVMVDVEVPATDRVYDFELDEESCVRELIDAMVALIVGQEKHSEVKGRELLYLYALRQEKVLNAKMNLIQQGVRNGDRLVLI